MPNQSSGTQTAGGQVDGNSKNAEMEKTVKRAIRGDRDALFELCEKIAKSVLFRTTFILNNPSDAEDVSQEVLIRVCEKIHSLREPKAFKVWLGCIVTNEVRRCMTRKVKLGDILNIDDLIEVAMEVKDDFLPQEHAEIEESRETVMGIIKSLPVRQREAVILRYYDGLSVTEVAKVMNIAKQNASRYLALAFEKLRSKLKESAVSTGVLNNAIALPTGVSLAWAVHREAEIFAPASESWLPTILTACRAFIISNQQQLLLSAATSASAKSLPPSQKISYGFMSAFAAVFAILALSLGLSVVGTTAVDTSSEKTIEGKVVFSGGIDSKENTVYVNPKSAESQVSSSNGEVKAISWWITRPENDEEALYKGVGGMVDEALSLLYESEGDGEYMIYFRLEDDAGAVHRLGSNFYFLAQPDALE